MYFHFPGGKVELAGAAVDRFAERSTARMRKILAEHDTVADAVAAIFDSYVEHLERTAYAEGCAVRPSPSTPPPPTPCWPRPPGGRCAPGPACWPRPSRPRGASRPRPTAWRPS